MNKPFVYIAALRRSGSTVLSEAVTCLPYTFIFREPNLCRNRFSLKPKDPEVLEAYGIDLKGFRDKWSGKRRRQLLAAFRSELVPQLQKRIAQVGVKEIRHEGWRRYVEAFPGLKILVTARDPRDMFLSLHQRVTEGKARWSGGFSPDSVAEDLNRQFRHQLEMVESCDCMRIRYEDFCLDPKLFEGVRTFIDSDAPGMGAIGAFNADNPNRAEEARLHGGRITLQHVARWRREPRRDLVDAAHRTFALMPDYVRFWGYSE